MQTLSKTSFAALLFAAFITFTGCNAGSLTGPGDASSPTMQPEHGSFNQSAPHNEISNAQSGGEDGSTDPSPMHNEI